METRGGVENEAFQGKPVYILKAALAPEPWAAKRLTPRQANGSGVL